MMRRTANIIIFIMLFGIVGNLFATDDPHGSLSSIYCEQCHIGHNSLGDILINSTDSLVSTLCLSCHTPGGWVGMNKLFSTSDKAIPGTSGRSHSWDVPVVNAELGSSTPTSQTLLDHLTADNRITCATCHDPHANSIPPFLRLDNSADALCLDCHAPRVMTSVRTWTGTDLSHPVGLTYPVADSTFHAVPLDVDGSPQPSDGNITNDLNLLSGSIVSCTSCHGVHYKDSNSGTVDGP